MLEQGRLHANRCATTGAGGPDSTQHRGGSAIAVLRLQFIDKVIEILVLTQRLVQWCKGFRRLSETPQLQHSEKEVVILVEQFEQVTAEENDGARTHLGGEK